MTIKSQPIALDSLTSLLHALMVEARAKEGTLKDSHQIYNQVINRLIPVLHCFSPLPLTKVITGNAHLWEVETPGKNS